MKLEDALALLGESSVERISRAGRDYMEGQKEIEPAILARLDQYEAHVRAILDAVGFNLQDKEELFKIAFGMLSVIDVAKGLEQEGQFGAYESEVVHFTVSRIFPIVCALYEKVGT